MGCASGSSGGRDEEFAGLGTSNASSEPPPGFYLPVQTGDLEAIAQRGRLLVAMHQALELGYEGVARVGSLGDDQVMPLVEVDPGGRSSQVVFLRWPRAAFEDPGALEPDQAQRWLLVSQVLEPEPRVLDVELLSGPVQSGSAEHLRVQAILEGAKVLRARFPEASFDLFAVAEVVPRSNAGGSKVVMRIYAMAVEGKGPDVELVLDEPKRKRPPELLSLEVVHPPGAIEASPIELELRQPSPVTVARILMREGEAADVPVRTSFGAWSISASTGRVTRESGS